MGEMVHPLIVITIDKQDPYMTQTQKYESFAESFKETTSAWRDDCDDDDEIRKGVMYILGLDM